jgi:hypothetical protein
MFRTDELAIPRMTPRKTVERILGGATYFDYLVSGTVLATKK